MPSWGPPEGLSLLPGAVFFAGDWGAGFSCAAAIAGTSAKSPAKLIATACFQISRCLIAFPPENLKSSRRDNRTPSRKAEHYGDVDRLARLHGDGCRE